MNPVTRYGGIIAGIVLIAFGIGSALTGFNGRAEVRDTLRLERITGTPDMDKAIANKPVDTGAKAKLFAAGMRKHTLAATDGQVYAQMAHYVTADGKPTDDKAAAATDPKTGKPQENAARNIWVTETALTTALDTSFFAERVAMFAIVMGAALLLVGTGFLVMLLGPWGAARTSEGRESKPAAAPPRGRRLI
jgi:hypothetical protein